MVPERLEQVHNLLGRPLSKRLGQQRRLFNFRGEAGGSATDDETRPVVRPPRLSSARERRGESRDSERNFNEPDWEVPGIPQALNVFRLWLLNLASRRAHPQMRGISIR